MREVKPVFGRMSIVLILALASGCVTNQSSQRNRELVHMRENYRLLEEDNRRLEGRLEALELENQRIQGDMFAFRAETEDAVRSGSSDLETRLNELERQMVQFEVQRGKDKAEIVNNLSQKIAKLMKNSGARKAPAGQKKSVRSEYGYEHDVKPGETLSEIANAYGVSVGVLIRENEMKNPNQLRVGQKLFIPE